VGIAAEIDEEALSLLAVAAVEAIPAAARFLDSQISFRPSVPTMSSSMLDPIIATLGRSPDWTPPS
jgi:hypothetical protein